VLPEAGTLRRLRTFDAYPRFHRNSQDADQSASGQGPPTTVLLEDGARPAAARSCRLLIATVARRPGTVVLRSLLGVVVRGLQPRGSRIECQPIWQSRYPFPLPSSIAFSISLMPSSAISNMGLLVKYAIASRRLKNLRTLLKLSSCSITPDHFISGFPAAARHPEGESEAAQRYDRGHPGSCDAASPWITRPRRLSALRRTI
jgi:hypothetical protein